jgi:hypothetical protein
MGVRCGSVVDDIRRKCYCGCGPEVTVVTSHRCVVCNHEVALLDEEVETMRAQGVRFFEEATSGVSAPGVSVAGRDGAGPPCSNEGDSQG